ncbi:cytochrome c oxidase subunit VIb [Cavenderia fasciculata]|uniref:Cytochrome c oxidase subunit VIb n=1 Tax=Cavenderia fasciculata TaxID=261658 RepID=F4PX65_CACFS|nr:cytochrome c oxidase subunit VIb [Cavenderia fasciculata]EGG19868.1 cytochrome c oxidase subunit VIb [Cavenderia fasciculata]|eukprot:XP_004358214.1 cytochrome c oxidase subunit VIb [Cavenderia fasciculata]
MSQPQQQQSQTQTGPVDISKLTAEERTKYSLLRAPDYQGTESSVLNTSRKACWLSRDQYFECLDKNNENKDKCKEEFEKFNNSCLDSWKRFIDNQKNKLMAGSTSSNL